jgi:hypothetical protein
MSIIFKMLKYLKNYRHLITGAAIIALAVVLVVQSVRLDNYKSSYEEEVKSGSAKQIELDSVRKQNKELQTQVSDQEKTIAEQDTEIQKLEEENEKLETDLKTYKARNTLTIGPKVSSNFKADGNYNQATTVWNYLRGLGFNEYVCAGIIGNIMAEVGGQTLDISRWPVYSQNSYYGICQWSGSRKQRLLNNFGTTLESQLRFLSVELFEVIPKGNSFYNMQDEKEAALYFAKYYERCGAGSYSVRQSNATKALNYFT